MNLILLTEVTPMESITTAVSSALGIVTTMLTTITGNPVLCCILAFSFVALGIRALKKLLKTR